MTTTTAQLTSRRVEVLWTNRQAIERRLDEAVAMDSPRLVAHLTARLHRLDEVLTEALVIEARYLDEA